MKLQGKKILVTGADGFIGSHLTEALVRAGHDVRAFVFYNSLQFLGLARRARPATSRRHSRSSPATSATRTACARR